MAQSLVTYLGGATKSSEWLRAAADPAAAIHFFDDGFGTGSFTSDTALNSAGYVGGHISTPAGANTNTCTSTASVCSAPSKLAFACSGRHGSSPAAGVVGVAAIAAGAAVNPSTTVGAYFTTSGGNLAFQVRDSNGAETIALGSAPSVDAEHGFSFDGGEFKVYVDGVLKGTVKREFPAGEMRFVAGNTTASASTNGFVSFDYVLVSADR